MQIFPPSFFKVINSEDVSPIKGIPSLEKSILWESGKEDDRKNVCELTTVFLKFGHNSNISFQNWFPSKKDGEKKAINIDFKS